jgi:hypothetical protein
MFGGGESGTMLHPVVLVAMVFTIVLMVVLRRKYVVVPFLFTVLLTPLGQNLYILGTHVFVLRILILVGWTRIAWTSLSQGTDLIPGGVKFIDKAFLLWAVCRASAIMLFYQASGAVINQGGFLWDALGGYFLLRYLIRDEEDVLRTIKTFALIATVLAVSMANEKLRGQNVFGFLGGEAIRIVPLVRDGAIRAQGAFEHPILAGTFGATLTPLFFLLWKDGKSKALAVLGMVASLIIVLAAAASTAVSAYLAGILALCFWPIRERMRLFRWGIVIVLVSLHLVMKAPVWMLIARIDLVSGNSGYHRAEPIDQCIRHFSDWWLIGTDNNWNWGLEMGDVGNQFVGEAVAGGLTTLVWFIAMISWSFGRIGTARRSVRGKRKPEWLVWSIGAALFAHIVAYFGISYFDQMRFAWYALLAIIPVATAAVATRTFKAAEESVEAVAFDSSLGYGFEPTPSVVSTTRGMFTN